MSFLGRRKFENVFNTIDLYVDLFGGNDASYVASDGIAKREYLSAIRPDGSCFANDISAFAMTEGPTDVVKRYFRAVESDRLVETILLHVDRPIETREFEDYSVWLNSKASFDFGPFVGKLTPEAFEEAMPSHPSPRLRIMVETFKADVLAA